MSASTKKPVDVMGAMKRASSRLRVAYGPHAADELIAARAATGEVLTAARACGKAVGTKPMFVVLARLDHLNEVVGRIGGGK